MAQRVLPSIAGPRYSLSPIQQSAVRRRERRDKCESYPVITMMAVSGEGGGSLRRDQLRERGKTSEGL